MSAWTCSTQPVSVPLVMRPNSAAMYKQQKKSHEKHKEAPKVYMNIVTRHVSL